MAAKHMDPKMRDERFRERVRRAEESAYNKAFIDGVNSITEQLKQLNALMAEDIERNKAAGVIQQ